MKPSKPYEEVQITPTLIWRWVREGDEYVMRISEMALEAHKAHIEAALAQPDKDSATELRRLHEVNQELLRLLIRYRHETPLGNQPYMAAIEADAAIAKAEGKSNE